MQEIISIFEIIPKRIKCRIGGNFLCTRDNARSFFFYRAYKSLKKKFLYARWKYAPAAVPLCREARIGRRGWSISGGGDCFVRQQRRRDVKRSAWQCRFAKHDRESCFGNSCCSPTCHGFFLRPSKGTSECVASILQICTYIRRNSQISEEIEKMYSDSRIFGAGFSSDSRILEHRISNTATLPWFFSALISLSTCVCKKI